MRFLGGLSVDELARRVWEHLWEDEVLDRAASLSYYFLFAIFPTLLFLTALLGLLPGPDLMDTLMGYIARVMPDEAVSRTLDQVVKGASGGLVSVGVLAALWAASAGTASIITALNVAYHAVDRRPWWRRRLLALVLTLTLSVFTLAALVLLVFGERIGDALARRVGLGVLFSLVWAVVHWPVVILFVLTGITLVYWLAPSVSHRWRWLTPGALFALAAWLAMSLGLKLYVTYFGNYNRTYGSIGGVILLMLWLYLSGIALLVGAEIDSEVDRARHARNSGRRGAPTG